MTSNKNFSSHTSHSSACCSQQGCSGALHKGHFIRPTRKVFGNTIPYQEAFCSRSCSSSISSKVASSLFFSVHTCDNKLIAVLVAPTATCPRILLPRPLRAAPLLATICGPTFRRAASVPRPKYLVCKTKAKARRLG